MPVNQFHRLAALFAPVALLTASALAGSVAWDGSCGSSVWTATCPGGQTNWMPEVIPGSGDDVSIPPGASVLVGGGVASTVSCLGSLNVSGSLELGNGGTVQSLTVSNPLFGITLLGGTLNLPGPCNWINGKLMGFGTLQNASTMGIGGMSIEGNPIFSNGSTVNVTSGISIGADAQVINNPGATFTLQHTNVNGSGVFRNNGTFIHNHGGSGLTFSPYIAQDAGELRIVGPSSALGTGLWNGGEFNGGVINLLNNGILRFSDPGGSSVPFVFNGLSSIVGQGNAYIEIPFFSASDWRVESDLTVNLFGSEGLVMSGKYLSLAADLTNAGLFKWAANTIRNAPCESCLPKLINNGIMTIQGDGVTLDTTLRNNTGITQSVTTSMVMDHDALLINAGQYDLVRGSLTPGFGVLPTLQIDNEGLFRKPTSPTTQDSQITVRFRNLEGATLHVQQKIIDFFNHGLIMAGGAIVVDEGAEICMAGIHNRSESDTTNTVEGMGRFTLYGNPTFTILDAREFSNMNFNLPGGGASGFFTTGGRMGGKGQIQNNNYWECTAATFGVSDGAGGFDANIANNGFMFVDGGFNMQGANSGFTNVNGATVSFVAGGINFTSGGVIFNSGLFKMIGNTHTFNGASGTFINSNMFLVDTGEFGSVTTSCLFSNLKTVYVKSGTLNLGPIVQFEPDGTLSGGEWYVKPGATLNFPGINQLKKIGPGVTVVVDGSFPDLEYITENKGKLSGSKLKFKQALTNEDEVNLDDEDDDVPILVPPTFEIDPLAPFTNSILGKSNMKVVVTAKATDSDSGGRDSGGIAGSFADLGGFKVSSFNNAGAILPGGDAAPGPFRIIGNLAQLSTGRIEVELGGSSPITGHDQVIVTGNVTLTGTLDVDLLGSFTPSIGQQFEILTIEEGGGTISGTFAQVHPAAYYSLTYNPQSVLLTVTGIPDPADLNGDGSVGGFDLALLLGAWTGAATYDPCPPIEDADLNGDCKINGPDLALLLSAWG